MAKLKLFSEIVDQYTKVWLSWDGFESMSSDDVVKFIESIPSDDNKIDIHINCPGGYVHEGFRMYDALRHSGKDISCVVEGLCASMATVVLMAAPKDKRVAYPNATFLIHNPEAGYISTGGYPERLTADEIEKMADRMKLQAEALRTEQEKILDVYVDRTGADRTELQKLMDEDITISAQRAIELGLISETLAPNTASIKNNNPMNKKEANVTVGQNWLTRLIAKAGFASREAVQFNDLSFTAADGSTFTVEREEGMYAVGDIASPDGKFVMEDGSTVDIAEGVIKDIIPAKMELKNPENGATISEEEAQQLLNNYDAKVKDLEAKIAELTTNSDKYKADAEAKDAVIAAKDAEIAVLNGKVMTDEQKAMVDLVNEAGGMEWLNAMKGMQSNGQPRVPQKRNDSTAKLGEGFLDDMKAKQPRIRVKS